jgi:hypothetical protein
MKQTQEIECSHWDHKCECGNYQPVAMKFCCVCGRKMSCHNPPVAGAAALSEGAGKELRKKMGAPAPLSEEEK